MYYFKLLHAKNLPKIAEVELSSCRLKKKLRLRNCGVVVAEQQFFKKLRNCYCGSASLKLRSCDCGLKKKLRVPTSAISTDMYSIWNIGDIFLLALHRGQRNVKTQKILFLHATSQLIMPAFIVGEYTQHHTNWRC
jgi:hypothetical protein